MRQICFLLGLSFMLIANPEEKGFEDTGDVLLNRLQLATQVHQDLEKQLEDDPIAMQVRQKSVGRAVLFSSILPGTGQLYAGSKWKAAAFLAIEATAWAVNINYNRSGKDKDTEFKIFADENWSEQRYWSYVYQELQGIEGVTLPTYQTTQDAQGRWLIDDCEQAEQVLREYDNTRYLEGFTHTLPETKTQQYYEMIGKYPEQFGNAWSDANFSSSYNGYIDQITDINRSYMDMRLSSNEDYRVAGYGARAALLNRLISALDAGFSTRRYNQRQLSLNVRNKYVNGEWIDLYGISLKF